MNLLSIESTPSADSPKTLPQLVSAASCFRCDVCCRFPEADSFLRRVVDRVLQIHGGIGLTLDLPLAKWFVDQRSRMITEGASEVMRMVIAREVLKRYN